LAKILYEPAPAIKDSLDPGVVASTYTAGPKISFLLLSFVSTLSMLVGAVGADERNDYLFKSSIFGSIYSLESTFDSSYLFA